jgi:hypothetical protein
MMAASETTLTPLTSSLKKITPITAVSAVPTAAQTAYAMPMSMVFSAQASI